ncbi:MAG: hypothetical protein HY040_29270 [Planctomycetes bacterium]|nr:hypothetical protein [Planctomycetota bacterium]
MRKLIFAVLTITSLSVGFARAQDSPTSKARFPAADNNEVWRHIHRQDPPLPAWARTLIKPLPRTTGAMLELDYVHRGKNPIGPVLAGKLRWAAADAIGCAYARRYAEADLRRAGLGDPETKKLTGDPRELSEADRAAMNFARKMTKEAYAVTDAEVEDLLKHFGPEIVVGMVHTLAYANFQNRIFLALGVEVEPGGPLPPLDVRLDSQMQAKIVTPPRPSWDEALKNRNAPDAGKSPVWSERSSADLAKAVEAQKIRKPRVPMPEESRLAKLPPEAKGQASLIVWSRVSMGYQPMLTKAWFDCMRTFQQESKLDRVFANSMFWVITRSNECFY